MQVTKVGGSGDGGIDLRGWWNVPRDDITHQALRVIGQCKAEKLRMGPRVVREMEGVARRAMDEAGPVLSVLCSQAGYTPGAFVQANTSNVPMLLLHIERSSNFSESDEDSLPDEGSLVGAYWNDKLVGPSGLLGRALEIRREYFADRSPAGKDQLNPFTLALFWKGKRINLASTT